MHIDKSGLVSWADGELEKIAEAIAPIVAAQVIAALPTLMAGVTKDITTAVEGETTTLTTDIAAIPGQVVSGVSTAVSAIPGQIIAAIRGILPFGVELPTQETN